MRANPMQELDQILREATRRVARCYFWLEIAGGAPVFRERVYCYELYHQMRCLWPVDCIYTLNGEVDKAGHPLLRELTASRLKPDLLVHGPGYMALNHAIIEVKSTTASERQLAKDFQTLQRFQFHVGYQRAILLVYGEANPRFLSRLRDAHQSVAGSEAVEVWLHRCPGLVAERAG